MLEKNRKQKGCWGISEQVLHQIDNEIYFHDCIGNYYSRIAVQWMDLFNQYEKGMLPYPGSLVEQPNKIIEIFRVIANFNYDKMAKEQKVRELKSKHGR